ncbi:hypothetical protein MKX01_000505 [Papaver californicum]|nr:hypothetical protein MKX01_000505 [Papaver californicum]
MVRDTVTSTSAWDFDFSRNFKENEVLEIGQLLQLVGDPENLFSDDENYHLLVKKAVKKGDTIFLGQYLFTGSETTSVWLEVPKVKEVNVVCIVKNAVILSGSFFFCTSLKFISIFLP